MSPDGGPAPPLPAGAQGDVHALAAALLLILLTAGTLLPLLRADGPPFPAPHRIEVGPGGDPRPPTGTSAPGASRTKPPVPAALDLNTVDARALQSLPGVGPVLAERIVAYRREHGPFRSVEDLLQVPGMGPKRWERIRTLVRVAERV